MSKYILTHTALKHAEITYSKRKSCHFMERPCAQKNRKIDKPCQELKESFNFFTHSIKHLISCASDVYSSQYFLFLRLTHRAHERL